MRGFYSLIICALLLSSDFSYAVGTDYRTLKPEVLFLNTVAFTRRDESSGATINSLNTNLGYIKLTATVATINGAVAPASPSSRMIVIQNNTGSSVTISHESGSAGSAAQRFSLPDATPIVLRHRRSVGFLYDHGQSRWVQMTSVVGTLDTTEVNFTPSNPGDWITAPTTAQEALDELGSRGGAGGATLASDTYAADQTLSDLNDVVLCNPPTGTTITLTLHSAATAKSKEFSIKNISVGGSCVVVPDVGDKIEGDTFLILNPGGTPQSGNTLIPNGGTSWSVW